MIPIEKSQINDEVEQGYKPKVLNAGLQLLPLNDLGDREFEILVYSLIGEQIKNNDYAGFDQIVLMKGVGERGRDCVLYSQGQVSGLVQCKKLQRKMSPKDVMEEIIKFLMFVLFEKELMPSPASFEYHLYASGGYSEPTLKLLSSFHVESKKELESGNALRIIQDLKEKYATFKSCENENVLAHVGSALDIIKVKYYAGLDIEISLASYPMVTSTFFRTMPVLDPSTFEDIISQKLQESGIKFLTDQNLSSLYKRLSSVPPQFQVALGNVDLYGFSKEYFSFLGKDGFSELVKKVADIRLFLDLKTHDFAVSLILPKIVENLTKPYVHTGQVIPFSLNVVAQYLVRRILPIVMSKSSPKAVLEFMHPHMKLTKQSLMDLVLEHSLESSRRFFNKDYSEFPCPDPDRERRLGFFEAMHAGYSNEVQLKERFHSDIKKIMPIVDNIEKNIISMIPEVRTIIINDMAYWDEEEKLKDVLTTIRSIDKKIRPETDLVED